MQALAAIRGVILDLDGTLLDTGADLVAGANGMRADLGLPPLPAERVLQFVGKGADRLVHRALLDARDGEAEPALFERGRAAFHANYTRENGRHARPYDGVVEGLDAMRAQGLRLACVTNKPLRYTTPLLEATGLAPYFELVLGGDSLPEKKPHPMPLQHVAERFGLPAQQFVMIGDSGNDVASAVAAGMTAWVVPYGWNEGEDPAVLLERGAAGMIATIVDAAQRLASARAVVSAAPSPTA